MALRTIIEGRIDHSTRDGQSSTDSYQSIQCRSHFNNPRVLLLLRMRRSNNL